MSRLDRMKAVDLLKHGNTMTYNGIQYYIGKDYVNTHTALQLINLKVVQTFDKERPLNYTWVK